MTTDILGIFDLSTVCPDPIHILSYYVNWVKASLTYSIQTGSGPETRRRLQIHIKVGAG